jgi:AraC-like DNA-binding protein
MAVALGTSCRSLQRELRVEGIGYQQLVKRYRMRHAKLLLREKRPNIKAIAYMLGFKDVGSFRRAFRGWTGKSVGAWQQTASGRVRPPDAHESRLGIG